MILKDNLSIDLSINQSNYLSIYLDIMEYRMGGGHLADMKRIRKQESKLQTVIDFFLKKVNFIELIRYINYKFSSYNTNF